jgi:hypothetical protein
MFYDGRRYLYRHEVRSKSALKYESFWRVPGGNLQKYANYLSHVFFSVRSHVTTKQPLDRLSRNLIFN